MEHYDDNDYVEIGGYEYAEGSFYGLDESEHDEPLPAARFRVKGRRPQFARYIWAEHVNFLNPQAFEAAKDAAQHDDSRIRSVANGWLRRRAESLRRYCHNPVCPQWSLPSGPNPLPQRAGQRGRPQLFCSSTCRKSALERARRNRENPYRDERGVTSMRHSLERPQWVREGRCGTALPRRKKAKDGYRTALDERGIDLVIATPAQIAELLDRSNGWTERHQELVERRGYGRPRKRAR